MQSLPKTARRGFIRAALLTTGLFATATNAADTNWPQWRGPMATGEAPRDAKPPTTWSETQNVKWKLELPGEGSSTPVVWGDKVFVQVAIPGGKGDAAATPEKPAPPPGPPGGRPGPGGPRGPGGRPPGGPGGGPGSGPGGRGPGGPGGPGGGMSTPAPTEPFKFALMCLDRQTGKPRWQKVLKEEVPHEGHHKDHGYASFSPVTDGNVVISYFGSRGLYCLDLDGNVKWSKDLGKQQTRNSFGEGSTPALHGDTVVVLWDHEGPDDFIAAFDKNTGNELWRQKREEETTWSSPLVVEQDGQTQVIAAASKKVRSYDLKTGKQIWELGPMTTNAIPTPVAGDGVVYVTSGYRGAELYAVKLGATGDLSNTKSVLWHHRKSTPYVPSPLLYQNRLYFYSGNNAILSIFDVKTGKPLVDTERLEEMQNVYASPVAAGGHIYLVARNGVTQVIKPGDKIEIVATNRLEDTFNASPAVAGTQMFLRGERNLYCVEAR